MNKVFYAASLLVGLSVLFCSCEKEGAENGKDDDLASVIVGCWAAVWEGKTTIDNLYEYVEITADGKFKEYYIDTSWGDYASFRNGVLYSPAGDKWKLDDVSKFFIEGNGLYCDSGIIARVSIIDNDTLDIKYAMATHWDNYTYYRIKKFATQ